MKNFLKATSRFVARFLIWTSITLFLLTTLSLNLIDNTSALETTIKESLTPETLINILKETPDFPKDINLEDCKSSTPPPECKILNNPQQILESQSITTSLNSLKLYNSQIILIKNLSIGLFLFSILLFYLGTFNFKLTLYKVFLNSSITSAFALAYYNLIPRYLLNANFLAKYIEAPSSLLNLIVNIVSNWISIPLKNVISLAFTITIIFIILTVIFYFLYKKQQETIVRI